MRIWLVQRAESTPHDDFGNRRIMRVGILANLLQSQGHEVIWWTSAFDHIGKRKRFTTSKRLIVKNNYSIHYIRSFGYKKNISLSRFIDNYFISNQFKKDIELEKSKPDLILTSIPSVELSKVAVRYAKKNKIPIVLDIRDLYPDVFIELLPKSIHWFLQILTLPMRISLKEVCKNVNVISGITDTFINWGIDHSGRKRNDKDICFPMAYIKNDLSDEKRNEAYSFWKKLGIIENDQFLNVVFIGTFTNSFNFQTIFSAAKILESKGLPIRFIFCGIGEKEVEIRLKCAKYNSCMFAGWINAAQIKVILELSDVGLAPYVHTKNFTENIPNKPAEYLSEKLLIATSLEHGKLFDLIKLEKCGLSYGENPNKLASFLETLRKDSNELKRLKMNAENLFNRDFDGNKVYNSMINFLESLTVRNSAY